MSNITTFGAFTSARLGIAAAQNALSVTGQNITNVNTKGYTRQRLDQMSFNSSGPNRYSSQYNVIIGNGVMCTGVSQIRDPFLDIRFRNEQANVGDADARLATMEKLSRVLDEVSRNDGNGVLEHQFNDLMDRLQRLSDQVGQEENDNLVRSSASTLVSLLNSYSTQLETIRTDQEEYLTDDVDHVNTLITKIRDLNDSIFKSELHGDPALEQRDDRNLLIDELSRYMKISVSTSPVQVGAGNAVDKLTIRLADIPSTSPNYNAMLVDGSYATKLSIAETGNYDINLAALTNERKQLLEGSVDRQLNDTELKGALQAMREMLTEAGEFTNQDTVTDTTARYYDPNAATKRGIPYYQKSLDALAQKLAEVMNGANNGTLHDSAGNDLGIAVAKAGNLFSNSSAGDDDTGITAANISISTGWTTGNTRIVNSFIEGATGGGTANSTDPSNILHMIYLMGEKQEYVARDVTGFDTVNNNSTYFKGGFQQMLTNICATLANDAETTTALLDNYTTVSTEIEASRQGISSVDLNDEAANLMQYQKSYAAACRMMTTLDEALDKLINGTGVVGR